MSAGAPVSAQTAAQAQAPTQAQPPTGAPYVGRQLSEVLEQLRAAGLDLLYSSQLVLPQMRVEREPGAVRPSEILQEVLAPHGLQARSIGANRFVIVRAAPPATERAVTPSPGQAPVQTLDEVLVHASRYALGRDVASSLTTLDRQQLDVAPGVEQDALRSLQRIPGSATAGLSALSHVRGSYEDEVLFRFDGVRLYEPFHLKDFQSLFGAIDPELIQTVEIFSGGFPAEFGDRAGAVLDITPRFSENAEHLIGTSVLYNRAISSGSHSQQRGQWLAGYRRSNLVPVLRNINRDVGEPLFEDVLARYSFQINPSLRAAAGFLALEDDHELFTRERDQQAQASYSDDAAWLRLDWERDSWALGLHAAHSHLSAQRRGTATRAGVSSGSLTESRISTIDEVRVNWSAHAWQHLHWSGGLEFTRATAAYDYSAAATFEAPLADTFARPATLAQNVQGVFDGRGYGPWVAARGEIGPATIELGLRYDEREWIENDGQWSPRASVRYDLDEATVLRASFGRFVQSQTLNELEVEEPDPRFAPPESSRQVIVGVERALPRDLSLRVELFDRHMRSVRPRFENVLNRLVLLPEIEVDRVRVAPLSSRARGVEVLLRSDPRKELSWWASYTWSRSDDRFADGETARSWDQRNAAYVGTAWRRDPWLVGLVVGYVSGWPFTDLVFEGDQGNAAGFTQAELGPRNRERFEDRTLLDLRAGYTLPLPRGELEFLVEIRNAASQGNDCCRDVAVTSQPGGSFSAQVQQEKWLTTLPILAINWRF